MKSFAIAATLVAMSVATAWAQSAPSTAPANPLRRPAPASAAPASEAAPAAPSTPTTRRARAKSTGDFAERRKRCSGEWRAAKAANTTGGTKWPQFFSACNTRLKAAGV